MNKVCPHSITAVRDSRPPSAYKEHRFNSVMVVRRRECQHCGYRFTTVEIPEMDTNGMLAEITNNVISNLITSLESKKITRLFNGDGE